jgi:hypothetical protein
MIVVLLLAFAIFEIVFVDEVFGAMTTEVSMFEFPAANAPRPFTPLLWLTASIESPASDTNGAIALAVSI